MSLITSNNRDTPLVSVVIPAYQAEAFILRAVTSVLNQSYQNIEVVVVDDGSTDKTTPSLRGLNANHLHLYVTEHAGVGSARNRGAREANGDYLAFLDADDFWHPDFVQNGISTITRYCPGVGIAYSGYFLVNDVGSRIAKSAEFRQTGKLFDALMHNESLLLPSTTLLHRDVFEKVGGFSTIAHHEDRSFFLKATKHYDCYPIPGRFVAYRRSQSGRCRSVLSDFTEAVKAEESTIGSLRSALTPDELIALEQIQMRNLLLRFLTNGHLANARRLAKEVSIEPLGSDIKSLLARWSLRTGLNLLSLVRQLTGFVNRTSSGPVFQAGQWLAPTLYK